MRLFIAILHEKGQSFSDFVQVHAWAAQTRQATAAPEATSPTAPSLTHGCLNCCFRPQRLASARSYVPVTCLAQSYILTNLENTLVFTCIHILSPPPQKRIQISLFRFGAPGWNTFQGCAPHGLSTRNFPGKWKWTPQRGCGSVGLLPCRRPVSTHRTPTFPLEKQQLTQGNTWQYWFWPWRKAPPRSKAQALPPAPAPTAPAPA